MIVVNPVYRTDLAPVLPSLHFCLEEFHGLQRLRPFLPALLPELPSYDILLTEFVLDLSRNRTYLGIRSDYSSYGSRY